MSLTTPCGLNDIQADDEPLQAARQKPFVEGVQIGHLRDRHEELATRRLHQRLHLAEAVRPVLRTCAPTSWGPTPCTRPGEAEIHGRFENDLTARQRLAIHKTGRVTGAIRHGHLSIEEGGKVAGDVAAADGGRRCCPSPTQLRSGIQKRQKKPTTSGTSRRRGRDHLSLRRSGRPSRPADRPVDRRRSPTTPASRNYASDARRLRRPG